MNTSFFKLVIFFLFTTSTCALCQSADSLIYAEGNVINVESKQPVVARITYQSLPYGNRVGVINTSSYSFPMYDGEKYSIIVEASGYTSAKYMLDPASANDQNRVVQHIELGAGAPKTAHEVGHVMLLNNLIFQVSKAIISPESYSELDLVVDMMKENQHMVIQLEGHTDYTGDPGQNLKLSQQRVDAVKKYLVTKGVHKKRVLTKAFGGTQPLSKDDTPEAHRMNRRVELRILKN